MTAGHDGRRLEFVSTWMFFIEKKSFLKGKYISQSYFFNGAIYLTARSKLSLVTNEQTHLELQCAHVGCVMFRHWCEQVFIILYELYWMHQLELPHRPVIPTPRYQMCYTSETHAEHISTWYRPLVPIIGELGPELRGQLSLYFELCLGWIKGSLIRQTNGSHRSFSISEWHRKYDHAAMVSYLESTIEFIGYIKLCCLNKSRAEFLS